MKRAINSIKKFTGRLGFGNRKANDQEENVVVQDVVSEIPSNVVKEPVELDMEEFEQQVQAFKNFILESVIKGTGGTESDDDDELFIEDIENEEDGSGIHHLNAGERSKTIGLSDDFIMSIFTCIIANSNMLIDTSLCQNSSFYFHHHVPTPPTTAAANTFGYNSPPLVAVDKSLDIQSTGSVLAKIIPLMCGLSCAYISCTDNTTSEELVQHLFLTLPTAISRDNSILKKNDSIVNMMAINNNNNNNQGGLTGLERQTSSKAILAQDTQSNSTLSRSTSNTSFGSIPLLQNKELLDTNSPTLTHRRVPNSTPPLDHNYNNNNSNNNQTSSNNQNTSSNQNQSFGSTNKKDYRMVDILIVENIDIAPLPTRYTLLQMMTYRKVAFKGSTYNTPKNFNIIATIKYNNSTNKNIDVEPLSPLILDNFLLNYKLDHPLYIPKFHLFFDPLIYTRESRYILSPTRIQKLREIIQKTYISHDIDQYIRTIIVNLRNHPLITFGPSPRATPNLLLASKSRAILKGQPFVTPTHILNIAPQSLNHRIFLFNPFSNDNEDNLTDGYAIKSKRSPSPLPISSSSQQLHHHHHHHRHLTTPSPDFMQQEMVSEGSSKSMLGKATLLPPPPIHISTPIIENPNTMSASTSIFGKIINTDTAYFDSFQVINIILENLPPPL
ncbi:hypothetical protein CYY_004267 [Polysphondylium violaceum]|uniref:magnesium chelatase n=1 Tax=Polysphondylium violaceum TaxID=133409 RepID=A0A8J4Q5P1_9MYCE|nr:hypothetical protein CYY_004267 [Polysphondylium violaceum]